MQKRSFTLIELLVVISIISILAALLIPMLNKARTNAKKISCISQQKQLMIGTLNYAADNNGWGHCSWERLGSGFYAGNTQNPDGILAYNGYLGNVKKKWNGKSFIGMMCPAFPMLSPDEYKLYAPYGQLGYGMNRNATFSSVYDVVDSNPFRFNLSKASRTSKTGIWGDATYQSINDTTTLEKFYQTGYLVPRHVNSSANIAFLDGHVDNYTVQTIKFAGIILTQ